MLVLLIPFVLFLSIVLCFLIWYYYNYLWMKSHLKTIPNVQQFPIVGCSHKFSNTFALYDNLLISYPRAYGKSFWLMAGPKPMLLTADLDLVEIILSSQKHVNKADVIKLIRGISKNGLLSAPVNIWNNHRKTLVPTLHYKVIENFVQSFNKCADKLVADFEGKIGEKSIEILGMAKMWSFSQAIETVLGLEVESNKQNILMYLECVQKLNSIVFQRLLNPIKYFNLIYYFTKSYQEELEVIKRMNDYVISVIERRIEELSKKEAKSHTKKKVASLDLMIKALQAGEWTLTDVLDQVHTLLFASFDTTALTISYTIYNFADHPDMQEKAYEEVKAILKNDGKKSITTDTVSKMKYLELFLKETMRVYTVGGFLPRKLGEDVKWAGLTLPRGLDVIIPIHTLHHDPTVYPEPHKTIPERFDPENSKNRHPYSYIPFSAGPRNCIGIKYAMLTLKICIAKLLLAYRFIPVGHTMERTVEMTIISKNGIKIALEKRE